MDVLHLLTQQSERGLRAAAADRLDDLGCLQRLRRRRIPCHKLFIIVLQKNLLLSVKKSQLRQFVDMIIDVSDIGAEVIGIADCGGCINV